MEENRLEPLQKILENLIEDKIQIKSQIDKLNRLYSKRESSVEEFKSIYIDLKSSIDLENSKSELFSSLSIPKPENQTAKIDPSRISQPKAQSLDSNLTSESKEKKIESSKKKFQHFRKSLAGLAKQIKTELDVFQVCFCADVEAIYGKINEINEINESKPKTILKSTEKIIETYGSNISSDSESDQPLHPPQESRLEKGLCESPDSSEPHSSEKNLEDLEFEDFSRIKSTGIKKKPKFQKISKKS